MGGRFLFLAALHVRENDRQNNAKTTLRVKVVTANGMLGSELRAARRNLAVTSTSQW